MKTNSKINSRQVSHFIISKLALLALYTLSSSQLFGQTGRTWNLVQDNGIHRIDQPGTYYTDCTVPQPGLYPYLTLHLRGGDGGKIWIQNLFKKTVRTGQGGQGATISAVFKIGTGANELKPGSKIRFIVGRGGDSHTNCSACIGTFGGGGGGGTGVLYLPVGADETVPANWKILAVAGGGGGGIAGTASFYKDGHPGQITEYGYISNDLLNQFYSDGSTPIFGHNGHGGQDAPTIGAGGGTSFLTWKQAANGGLWGDGISTVSDLMIYMIPGVSETTSTAGEGGNRLMGETMNLSPLKRDEVGNVGGKGLFQRVDGKLLPVGGMGGSGSLSGGYGFGGGGGTTISDIAWDEPGGGGGGGYSGGWPGTNSIDINLNETYTSTDRGGGGGGSYLNPMFVLASTGLKTQNGVTSDPGNGYVDYQFSATNPRVARDLYFECHKGTEVSVLKAGAWTLLWQYDGNLVLYGPGFPNGAWASNTAGTDLIFQGDGNLVIYQANAGPWASDTANDQHGGKGGRKLVLTPDGDLYITDQDAKVIWKGH